MTDATVLPRRQIAILALSALALALAACGSGPHGGPTPAARPAAKRPLTVRVDESSWPTPFGPGTVLTTRNYKIWTTLRRGRELRSLLPGFLEAAHETYLEVTGLPVETGDEKMDVYVLADRRQWASLTEHRLKKPVRIEAGGYTADGVCVFWDIGGLPTLSVAAHEGLHQFFHHRLVDRNPMWLEEGLCTTAEGFDVQAGGVTFTPDRNNARFSDLRQAIVQGHWKPLKELLRLHSMEVAENEPFAEKAVGYYGQLWALLHMIRNTGRYRAGMERMLADAAAGRYHQALGVPAGKLRALRRNAVAYNRAVSIPLFQHYIAEDIDAFEAEYRAYAEKLAGG